MSATATESLSALRSSVDARQRESTSVGSPLRDRDYEFLAARWIDKETAQSANLRYVTHAEGAGAILYRENSRDLEGILIPYYRPGETRPRASRIRRDRPDMVEGKPKNKYMAAAGVRNMLYFHPCTPLDWLGDSDLPLVITEGEMKCNALWRLAWHEVADTASHGRFLPVALSGVWNWRGTIGKTPAAGGGTSAEKGPIPDLDWLNWEGRTVYIVFDTNVKTNEMVRHAREALTAHLIEERHAAVFWVDLPAGKNVNGVDDLLAVEGPARVLDLIDHAKAAKAKKEQARLVERVLTGIEFLRSKEEKQYAIVEMDGRRELYALRSSAFNNLIGRRLFDALGQPPSAALRGDVFGYCTAAADTAPASTLVGLRTLSDGQRVYLDLTNERWEVVEVDAEGWRPSPRTDVYFRRSRGMQAIPGPAKGGSWDLLRACCNCDDEQTFILLCAWLIGAMAPEGPYPILIVQGEQGSGKSSTSEFVRSLIDPATPLLRSEPKDERDMMIAAVNNRIFGMDNLTGVQRWLSNALCRLSTGGGFATRQLHADDEEILFEAQRPVLMNGIQQIATAPDLIERSIIVHLPPIAEDRRRSKAAIAELFTVARPKLLGCLLDAVAGALACRGRVKLESLPRMADFTIWVAAACLSGKTPFSQEQFLEAYMGNREDSIRASIEDTPIALWMQRFAETLPPMPEHWAGSARELLEALAQAVPEDVRKAKTWPQDVRSLGNRLREVAPMLRRVGVDISFTRDGKERKRLINIRNRGGKDVRLVRQDEISL